MKNLPDHIFFEIPDQPGAGFILCTKFPFYIGKVFKFKTADEMEDFAAKQKASGFFVAGKPLGYNIIIGFHGALERYQLPNNNKDADELAKVYRQMSDFYLKTKIEPHKAAFKRYEEQ